MATASVTLALNQSTFLAGIARAQSSVSALGTSVGRIGSRGFLIAGTAAVAFGTAAAVGIKKAFDLGGSLADMSAISGRSVKSILLLRRALEDAGVSMEKIDRFILTGQDRGEVIARALKGITAADWADAAKSLGTQADVLDKNAATFDRISDLLGRSTDKLQGFFVGAAGSLGKSLLPILEKFDKLDFASQGAKFGAGLLLGAQALVGFFKKPELIFKTATDYFGAAIFGVGNVLIAVFKTGIQFFRDGMLQAFVGIGSALAATLIESFKRPLAQLQAGFEELVGGGSNGPNERGLKARIAFNEAARDIGGKDMSGKLNSIGVGIQKQIDADLAQLKNTIPFEQRVQDILKAGGPRLGFGEGQTADQFRKQATQQSGAALDALSKAAADFKVEDVLGVSEALKKASLDVEDSAKLGRNMLPVPMSGGNRRGTGGFTVSGGGPGLTEGGASNFMGIQSDKDFANRWEIPKTPGVDASGVTGAKANALLEKLAASVDQLNGTTEKAWGGGGGE